LRRSLALRRAGLQGAARRSADLAATSRIARSLARLLTPEVTSVTIAQSYLPFLWREGHLGGRQVLVLMTRLPMTLLQARLDAAAAAHPEHATLADFRAPAWLAEAEAEALAGADRIITPHAEIAALFADRAIHLSWQVPAAGSATRVRGRRIVFPGPTVARKGAHLLRDAAAVLGLEVMPLGAELEGPGFWKGVRTIPAGDWSGVAAVVQPALVEEQPRRLLAALAAGIPVIATPACGIAPRPGLCLIPPEDRAALIEALAALMAR
ncbi:MAG TPA: glycosyltransferase, partial [Dongiaceae bacterium]|nr:glycosyltransferase [Dongiaceae bacterium]